MMPADSEVPPFSAIGSDAWLGANEYEPGSPLHTLVNNFLKAVKWDVLVDIASQNRGGISCCYEDKFSLGHLNMVRRINFEDGMSYVVRLRLPDEDICAKREALTGLKVMEIEIASMKFFRSKTSILVPKVMDYSTASDNAVGTPYILMEYIHGSAASELRQAKPCELQMFGTPERDRSFREQMAQIQASVVSFRFPKIGGLYHNPDTDEFYIEPELQTGRGPWTTSTEYYDDLVDHLLKSASTSDEPKQGQSFMLPSILGHLMRIHGAEGFGPFRLTNREFAPTTSFVMAAPLEVVAQYPTLSFFDVDPPGVVYTVPAAVEQVKRTTPKLQHYKELLVRFAAKMGGLQGMKVADKLGSTPASIYREMQAYAQHQDAVNERWMKACLKVLDFAESGR